MSGKVTETMDAAGYTYVQFDAGDGLVWAAAPQFTVAVGDDVSIPPGMPMMNYHSNSLDRDFDVVYFVAPIAVGPEAAAAALDTRNQPAGQPAPTGDASGSGMKKTRTSRCSELRYSNRAAMFRKNVRPFRS